MDVWRRKTPRGQLGFSKTHGEFRDLKEFGDQKVWDDQWKNRWLWKPRRGKTRVQTHLLSPGWVSRSRGRPCSEMSWTRSFFSIFSKLDFNNKQKNSNWGVSGFDFDENFDYEDFYTSWFVISVFYTITTFHSFIRSRHPTSRLDPSLVFSPLRCLLWINKARVKEKTYMWALVRWKTKN
jgi:hypothetical protein